MKKATKFNLVLGFINLFFIITCVVCLFLQGGVSGIVNEFVGVYTLAVGYFQGLPTLWGGSIIEIAIFACLALLALITLILMIESIVKKQGYFWEPLSILALATLAALIYKDYEGIISGIINVSSDLVEGLRCITLCALTLGVLIYMIIAVSVISKKRRKAAPEAKEENSVEETPAVEEIAEEPVPEVKEEVVPEVKEETPVVEEKVEKPAPVEPATKVKEEPKVEEKPQPKVKKEEVKPEPVRESKPVFIIDENGNKVYPGRDFEDRLYEADPVLLQMYSDLKNEFLSYRKVHTRVSKTNDAFRFEGTLVGKMIVSGKGLKVYLALDPLSVDSAIYHQRDASGKKKFVETPLEVKVKSPLSFRKAKQLIALAMEKTGTVKKTRYTPIDWTKPNAKEKVEA